MFGLSRSTGQEVSVDTYNTFTHPLCWVIAMFCLCKHLSARCTEYGICKCTKERWEALFTEQAPHNSAYAVNSCVWVCVPITHLVCQIIIYIVCAEVLYVLSHAYTSYVNNS